MGNFNQAMEWMEEGHKVRISTWENKDYYWWVDMDYCFDNLWCIQDPHGNKACLIRSWIKSNKWEKLKEKK